jgi:hypothetical protein
MQLLRPRGAEVGRILTKVAIRNIVEKGKVLQCEALVDTGASHLVLPKAWRGRLGTFENVRTEQLEMADQSTIEGEICGPAGIQIAGFPEVSSEVLFIEMDPNAGDYEVLLGYIPLEQAGLAVDMLGHRLVRVKHMDLK